MSYKVKQLGNKYICVGPGNARLPEIFRSKRLAMNHIMSLGAAKGDLVRAEVELIGNSIDSIILDDSSSDLLMDELSVLDQELGLLDTKLEDNPLVRTSVKPKVSSQVRKSKPKLKKKK